MVHEHVLPLNFCAHRYPESDAHCFKGNIKFAPTGEPKVAHKRHHNKHPKGIPNAPQKWYTKICLYLKKENGTQKYFANEFLRAPLSTKPPKAVHKKHPKSGTQKAPQKRYANFVLGAPKTVRKKFS